MATPKEKFIESLKFLKGVQDSGAVALYTDEIPKKDVQGNPSKKWLYQRGNKGLVHFNRPRRKRW